jgi:hypothetical protein
VHHKLEELLDQYLKATGLEKEPGSPLFPASIGKTGKLSRRPFVRTDAADMLKRRLKKLDCRRIIRLTHFGPPASRIFWKMTALLKPLNASPATPTAGPRNSMIAAVRRCSSKTWRGLGIEFYLALWLTCCISNERPNRWTRHTMQPFAATRELSARTVTISSSL